MAQQLIKAWLHERLDEIRYSLTKQKQISGTWFALWFNIIHVDIIILMLCRIFYDLFTAHRSVIIKKLNRKERKDIFLTHTQQHHRTAGMPCVSLYCNHRLYGREVYSNTPKYEISCFVSCHRYCHHTDYNRTMFSAVTADAENKSTLTSSKSLHLRTIIGLVRARS